MNFKRSLVFISLAILSLSSIGQANHPINKDSTDSIAKQKASALYNRTTHGESFENLAILYSDDLSANKNKGMLIGKLSDFDEPLRTAITKLQPGQIAPPFRTDKGYLIIKLDSIDDNHYTIHLIAVYFKK